MVRSTSTGSGGGLRGKAPREIGGVDLLAAVHDNGVLQRTVLPKVPAGLVHGAQVDRPQIRQRPHLHLEGQRRPVKKGMVVGIGGG